MTRPDVTAGPIERNFKPAKVDADIGSGVGIGVGEGVAVGAGVGAATFGEIEAVGIWATMVEIKTNETQTNITETRSLYTVKGSLRINYLQKLGLLLCVY